MANIELKLTEKQRLFVESKCYEVLYGGALGGGKSYGQVIDAFAKAIEYKGIKQLILRTTFPELKRSLIMTALAIIPQNLYKYNQTDHIMNFINGSIIEFGYCATDIDVRKYDSAEYDIIRFDELTHFNEYQYTEIIKRCRGANKFPKQIKSSTNPGNLGHKWVKERFVDVAPPNREFTYTIKMLNKDTGIEEEIELTRIFIPALLTDNKVLMEENPNYIFQLKSSMSKEKQRALIYGEWDLFEGQYFNEFRRDIHTCKPFEIPSYWKKFRSLDYGLDMTACYWWAVNEKGRCFIYRELHQPNLKLSECAKKIKELSPPNEKIAYTVASPDLWNRRQETGQSGMEILANNGIMGLIKADNQRVAGWRALREYLSPYQDEQDITIANICFFENCVNIIKCLPELQHDEHNSEDVADKPHDITHAPESIRYGIMSRPQISYNRPQIDKTKTYTKTELEDLKAEFPQKICKAR